MTLMPTGVRTPVVSMSMRPLIGIVQALLTPGMRTASSIWLTRSSQEMRSGQMGRNAGSIHAGTRPEYHLGSCRHLPCGFSTMVVSIIENGAGSVDVSARPALPITLSTSGKRLRALSWRCTDGPLRRRRSTLRLLWLLRGRSEPDLWRQHDRLSVFVLRLNGRHYDTLAGLDRIGLHRRRAPQDARLLVHGDHGRLAVRGFHLEMVLVDHRHRAHDLVLVTRVRQEARCRGQGQDERQDRNKSGHRVSPGCLWRVGADVVVEPVPPSRNR